jgi:glycosyltransferase involved in cell wall biosynthesis
VTSVARPSSGRDPSPTVLHVSQPTVDGVARVVSDLVADQVSRGWDVVLACPSEGWLADEAACRGARVVSWRATRNPGLVVLPEMLAFSRLVRAVRPDLVHLHSSKAGLVGRLVLRGRRPTAFQGHGWSFHAVDGAVRRLVIRWETFATRWAHLLICESEEERMEGVREGLEGQWALAPNSVDIDRFHPPNEAERREARTLTGVSGSAVVCVGRLCRAKGQDVLLAAWDAVLAAVPDAELVLVGGYPDSDAVPAALQSEGLPRQVRLVGQQRDVRPWLHAADVVAAPSRWDTHSIAILEAMACGRSVVATLVAGARESIGSTGAVVPAEDPRALAGAIIARLSDPALREREGLAARDRAASKFSSQVGPRRVGDLYPMAIGSFRAARTRSG